MKRKEGYYWVETINGWRIAEWKSGNWYLVGGANIFTDSDWLIIDENMIDRPIEFNSICVTKQEVDRLKKEISKAAKITECQVEDKMKDLFFCGYKAVFDFTSHFGRMPTAKESLYVYYLIELNKHGICRLMD